MPSTTRASPAADAASQSNGVMMTIGSRVRIAAMRVAAIKVGGNAEIAGKCASSPFRSPGPTRRSSPHSMPEAYQAAMARSGRGRPVSATGRCAGRATSSRPVAASPLEGRVAERDADQVIGGPVLRRIREQPDHVAQRLPLTAHAFAPDGIVANGGGLDQRVDGRDADVLEGDDQEPSPYSLAPRRWSVTAARSARSASPRGSPCEAETKRPRGRSRGAGELVAKMKAPRRLTTVQGLKIGWAWIVAQMAISSNNNAVSAY